MFVAVHLGAGNIGRAAEPEYKALIAQACSAGREHPTDAAAAVAAAIAVLETNPLCNAGLGSNLNRDGAVECDASICCSDGTVGAVGSVSGLASPIAVARALASESHDLLPGGLVSPLCLVGDGARRWAESRGLETASAAELPGYQVTGRARQRWERYRSVVAKSGGRALKRRRTDEAAAAAAAAAGERLDTVGAVCLDAKGRVASGVSSGGIVLKVPGRLGHAASLGAGCWSGLIQRRGVAAGTSTSGCGEAIMRSGLAESCGRALLEGRGERQRCWPEGAVAGPLESLADPWRAAEHAQARKVMGMAGVVALHAETAPGNQASAGSAGVEAKKRKVMLVWGFTTPTFGVGYAHPEGRGSFVLRKEEGSAGSVAEDGVSGEGKVVVRIGAKATVAFA